MSAYLDTHVAVWLHDGLLERLTAEARKQIEANDLLISPMVLLEIQYLYRRKRIGVRPAAIYAYLNTTFGIETCDLPFSAVVMEAAAADWTSDPFDRMIVGQAKANREAMLITSDNLIRRHYSRAVW